MNVLDGLYAVMTFYSQQRALVNFWMNSVSIVYRLMELKVSSGHHFVTNGVKLLSCCLAAP